jgi:methyl-accepting chemotaxis protein
MRVIRKFRVTQDDVIELEVAKAAHQAWKMRLRAFLDGHADIPHEQAVSSHECDFGRWYYTSGKERYGSSAALGAIEKPHDRLHQLIGEIIEAKHHGKEPEAERKYQEVAQLSGEIVSAIDRLIQEAR